MNSKYLKIIEFNGLPGAGKTTVTNEIIKILSFNNIDCLVWKHMLLGQNYSKIYKLFYFLSKINVKELLYLFLIATSIKGFDWEMIKRILISERICIAYRTHSSNKSVCIIDQGIVQAIASMTLKKEVINTQRFQFYSNKLFARFKCVYVNAIVDLDVSINRLRTRTVDNNGRLDKINNGRELKELVNRQLFVLSLLRATPALANSVNIDMNLNPVTNSNTILNLLNTK